ncbi:MAG: M23 family metallopeptidase [Sphingobacteriales bacterium]|nr:MAG: M23 family metallopeptidase [Sphingobacteriales bacterium]
MQWKQYLTLLAVSSFGTVATAQNVKGYPQGYFRNPLDIPILLAGNFGECRPGHFHSGMDIKTQGKENMPVHAAADGYISRIKLEKGGFGHALYVTHSNGYTTLYAHLNKFADAVQKYVAEQQYKNKSWLVDITLKPEQFPIKQGEQIALSGNTGNSYAPHLHFEIRNTQSEHPLNPQLFGFDIKDDIAPKPTQLALYDMSKGVYEQTPRMFLLTKKDNTYYPNVDTIVVNNDQIGVGVAVNDYMNGSDNTLNFYTADLSMEGSNFIHIALDDIGYDVTRYVNAFADYKTKKQTGEWVQCLFQMDGNKLDTIYSYTTPYRKYTEHGKLEFSKNLKAKPVEIKLTDAAGNTATIAYYIKYIPGQKEKAQCSEENKMNVFKEENYGNPNISFTLGDDALYENLCMDFKQTPDANSYSDRFSIHKPYVPVHSYFMLRIKPNKAIPFKERYKIALIYSDGKTESGSAATYDEGWYKTKVRDFGEYSLVSDVTPPTIVPLQPNGTDFTNLNRISFTAKDALTSVKSFTAEINGNWICFEQSGDTFFYDFDEHCPKGKNKMVLTAVDENNNEHKLTYTFTR